VRAALRYLRHGPLKRYQHSWLQLGKLYHHFVKLIPILPTVKQKVGAYGPFRFHPCFAFSAFDQWGSDHNAGFTDCIEHCRNKSCVIDIGAHIGLVTMPMSQVIATNGIVYAFEPAKANRHYLDYHLKKNRLYNVEVIPFLVGNSNNDHTVFYEMNADTGMNSVIPIQHKGNFKPTTKQQITLDYFCQQRQIKPDLLKIDVEGYELAVLQGAKNTLMKNSILIYLSVHPQHLKKLGHSTDELCQFIHSIGYDISELDGTPVNTFTLSEYLVQPSRILKSSLHDSQSKTENNNRLQQTSVMGFYTIESSTKPKFKAKSEKKRSTSSANTSIFFGF